MVHFERSCAFIPRGQVCRKLCSAGPVLATPKFTCWEWLAAWVDVIRKGYVLGPCMEVPQRRYGRSLPFAQGPFAVVRVYVVAGATQEQTLRQENEREVRVFRSRLRNVYCHRLYINAQCYS